MKHNILITLLFLILASLPAFRSNTTGYENVSLGRDALRSNTTGLRNIAIGLSALRTNTIGSLNFDAGYSALYSNTTGNTNSAIGSRALYFNTTGYQNTAYGSDALYSNTTGHHNAAIGANALYGNTTGIFNTGIGTDAGRYLADGAGQINQTVIGFEAIGNGSNTITLGNSSIVHHYLSGTGQVNIPGGTTAQRQAGENGDIRFSSTNNRRQRRYNRVAYARQRKYHGSYRRYR